MYAVEGRHTPAPSTGPYLGESFEITVNSPPVADAGADITAECTSHTTTPVMLDGTGSSDPDGDDLTYLWSAAGVAFDDATSMTPTGQFSLGATLVTLTVSDGIQSDSDEVLVTVEDTTPPDITCPSDIVVECTEHGGTPADDPQLAPFFAGVSATDVCDDDPTIADNAPDFFPLGDTIVTFTATDESDNESECTATVTVEDTTPPEITVVVHPDVLWPPNHKLVDIEAMVTVTDICDPDPTFVLTSIVSNEPDEGTGDGDFPDDIQEASYGTPDVEFQLRSERAGPGDGRIYTITYTASDMSGNTADDVDEVTVPHNQGGHARSSSGFGSQGASFSPGADRFALVVLGRSDDPSTPEPDGLDTGSVDAARAYVGNTAGAIRPLDDLTSDVNGDGRDDLVLFYSVAGGEEIALASDEIDGPLGLHYRSEDATGTVVPYLVPDVFALGSPIPLEDVVSVGSESGDVDSDSGEIGGESEEVVEEPKVLVTALTGAYPNPFRSGVTIMFDLAEPHGVTVEIYDARGALVRSLVTRALDAGRHTLTWDGRTGDGQRVGSGIYVARLRAGSEVSSHKLTVVN